MNSRQSLLNFSVVRWLWAMCLGIFMACTASANGLLSSSKHEFLPVEQAFQTSAAAFRYRARTLSVCQTVSSELAERS